MSIVYQPQGKNASQLNFASFNPDTYKRQLINNFRSEVDIVIETAIEIDLFVFGGTASQIEVLNHVLKTVTTSASLEVKNLLVQYMPIDRLYEIASLVFSGKTDDANLAINSVCFLIDNAN